MSRKNSSPNTDPSPCKRPKHKPFMIERWLSWEPGDKWTIWARYYTKEEALEALAKAEKVARQSEHFKFRLKESKRKPRPPTKSSASKTLPLKPKLP